MTDCKKTQTSTNFFIFLCWYLKKINILSFILQSGFVDGIISGRDSVFQDGFDEGYKDGFLNGFKIGQQQGIFLAAKKDESNFIVDHTTRGNCQICGNQELLSLTISKLSTHQTSHFKEKYRTIEKTYKHLQNFIKD